MDAPHLRIVSDETWQAVTNRLASVNAAFSSGVGAGLCSRSHTARYLFSRFLKCGLRGSNIVLISGRGGAGWAKYGCPLHQNRGMCANEMVVRRDRIEQELISVLQRGVLREDVAAFALEEFKLDARIREIEELLEELGKRERELDTISEESACPIRVVGGGLMDVAMKG